MTAEQLIFAEAQKIGVCDKLKGTESVAQLAELLWTAQGMEYCETHQFPQMEVLRKFDKTQLAAHGIYCDASVAVENAPCIALFGEESHGVLEYRGVDRLYKVLLMHGAKATIKATDYAVVSLTNVDSHADVQLSDYAFVL